MKFGLQNKHWNFIQKTLIEPLKSKGAKIWIFGSRAKGTHHPFSDLDVLYEDSLRQIDRAFIAQISELLEESNLPIKIDIVRLDDLAESYKTTILAEKLEV